MRILFDPSFDAPAWPGPLGARPAAAGEVWAGPAYLLDLLETALGLGGPPVARALRVAALVPAVRATAGFWSRSAEVDPLGTAGRLLAWRDHLWLAGWRGQPVAPRLAALAAVTAGVLPGPPDRLAAVAEALGRRAAEIERIEILEPTGDLAPLWRRVLAALAAGGTRVETTALAPAAAAGDLAAGRHRAFRPAGDGSLQLLRPHGPLQAAEEVAAWLATSDDLGGTVVIGADATLDAALGRHGLPTTGTTLPPRDNAILQILPLVLALAWSPPDPRRALELLTLPVSPVPRAVAWRLARALHEWPAVDSDGWRAALADGLAAIDDAERRARARERLAVVFDASIGRGARYPAAEVRRRLDALAVWIRGRVARETNDTTPWQSAARACAVLRDLVDHAGLDALSAAELERFVEEAMERELALEAYPAEAGLAAVRSPGAVAGAARRIVWWDFTLESVPPLPAVPLARDERRALAAAGIPLPDVGLAAVAAAARWRRPLLQATGLLLLVCPHLGEDGTERHPHPLWDEIEAGVEGGDGLAALEGEAPAGAPAPVARALRALPAPRRIWNAGAGRIGCRPTESPSSLGDLLGCSFKWTVQHHGRLWAGATATLPDTTRLLGSVAHVLLARLLEGGIVSPEAAEAAAYRLFDAEAPRLAAPLFLPGADAARADARQVTGLAARELFRALAAARLEVRAVERRIERSALDGLLGGVPDLVVESPAGIASRERPASAAAGPSTSAIAGARPGAGGRSPAVVDLKWSGARYRRDELRAGTAHQLAAYAYLVREDAADPFPPVAFFILRDQRLLTTDPRAFPGAERIDGADPGTTWRALERAYARRRAALDAGTLEAPANPDADGRVLPERSAIEDGTLVLPPPCVFCDLAALCGAAFGSGRA
jgi:ATP-dependent helicase/nuclease subunit B